MSNFNRTVFTLLLSSTVATAASTITMTPSAQAEQIVIPVGTQAATSTLDRPTQGMSGHDVIAQFGEPISSSQAVGTPPITHWEYEAFSVYFEFDRVIHTVLKKTTVN